MTAKDLKNRTGDALRAVARGQRVLLTRRGRPVAIMTPTSAPPIEPEDLSYEDAWKEIDVALRTTKPRERTWAHAMDRSRRRP